MKTEELISLLAAGETKLQANTIRQRFVLTMAWGVPASALIMLCVFGVRSDLSQAMGDIVFWIKPAFATTLALYASLATWRLGRPGVRVGSAWLGMAIPLALLWLLALVAIVGADPLERGDLIFGSTWTTCPFNIALISLPLLAAIFWFMKGLAPTKPMVSGASAGLLSGALATLIYSLHCPESSVPFVAIWYVMGIFIPTAAGVFLGPRLLRW
jgi:hypothetical protein